MAKSDPPPWAVNQTSPANAISGASPKMPTWSGLGRRRDRSAATGGGRPALPDEALGDREADQRRRGDREQVGEQVRSADGVHEQVENRDGQELCRRADEAERDKAALQVELAVASGVDPPLREGEGPEDRGLRRD